MRKTLFPVLTAAELAQAGEALFGVEWRAPMARALGLADDAPLRAVESGAMAAPPEWRARLIETAQDAAVRAMDVAAALLWREVKDPASEGFSAQRLV